VGPLELPHWYDPSDIPAPLEIAPANPLAPLATQDLAHLHNLLIISCGKGKLELKKKHRRLLCFNAWILATEKRRREKLEA
jgi:hypothetical protein